MHQIEKFFTALGTVNSLSLNVPDPMSEKALLTVREISGRVQNLDRTLSVFLKDSEISRIAEAAGMNPVPVSRETLLLIEKSVSWSHITDGAFDISAGPLIRLWEIGKKGSYVPSDADIRKAVSLINADDILTDRESMTAGLRRPGQSLDLGSIAKGYAADAAAEMLQKSGIMDFTVSFGGTVLTGDLPKKIGIRNPFDKRGAPIGTIVMKNQAAVTSGSYEHSFRKDQRLYHHILNPKTGYPAETNLASVTLTGSSAEELDVITTMVFVQGVEKTMPVLKERNIEGTFIFNTGELFITPGLAGNFQKEVNQNVKSVIS